MHIITRKASNKWRIRSLLGSLTEHKADLQDKEMITSIIGKVKPSIIYHLAAYGTYHFQRDLEDIMKTNVLGTVNLLNACSKVGFDHFINAGSSSEYGIKDHPMKETDTLEPIDFYGVSKATATLICQCLAKLNDLPITTLRLFAVYGYYEEPTRLVPTVIRACLLEENPKLLSPFSVRDFIFVEDIIDVFLKMASVRKESSGGIYNVGYGKQYSVSDVVSKIIELTGSNVQPLWGRAENRERREPKCWVSDISKIRRFLGWQPKYDLEDGLKKTISWFKRNLHLYEQAR